MYKKGKEDPADYMSRHPSLKEASNSEYITEQYIIVIVQETVPKILTLNTISEYTSKEETISKLIQKQKPNKVNATEITKDTKLQAYRKLLDGPYC